MKRRNKAMLTVLLLIILISSMVLTFDAMSKPAGDGPVPVKKK